MVEFGPATAPVTGRRGPRWRAVASDSRLTASLAVLGGAAAVASLMGEWQIIDIAEEGDGYFNGVPQLANSVWTVPMGPAYLIGLVLLGALAAVALYGPGPARAAARVAGIGAAAVLAVVVGTAAAALGTAQGVPQFFGVGPDVYDRYTVSLGRGLWAALAALVLLGLALLAAHRAEPAATPPTGAGDAGDETDDYLSGDIELTVTTAAPFIRQY